MPTQMPSQMQFQAQAPIPGQMTFQAQAQAQTTNQIYTNQMVNQGGLMTNMYQQVNQNVINNNNFTNNNIPTPNQTSQGNSNDEEPQTLIPGNTDMIGKIVHSEGVINAIFEASTGSTAVIQINDKTPVKEAIEKYAEKIKLNQRYIGKEVIFVLNGKKMDPSSNKILVDFIKKTNPNDKVIQFKVNVFDQSNVLGA